MLTHLVVTRRSIALSSCYNRAPRECVGSVRATSESVEAQTLSLPVSSYLSWYVIVIQDRFCSANMKSAMSTVEVLLSTFNGETYLGAFLGSLCSQSQAVDSLRLRDDGSADNTLSILKDSILPFRVIIDPDTAHLGIRQSYFQLLCSASTNVDFVAFADQDDVWLPSKISAAVTALQDVSGPAMYFSNVLVVDRDLEPIKLHHRMIVHPSFANALVENVATGHTIVLNQPARQLLCEEIPCRATLHDAWCYLVLSGCGRVIYDPQPRVLYRQHRANALGVKTTLISSWTARVKRQVRFGAERQLYEQALELKSLYSNRLTPSNLVLLDAFLRSDSTLLSRLNFAFRGPIIRQTRLDTIIARSLYVLRRL